MSFNWFSKTGRKFALTTFSVIVATVALFVGKADFIAWAGFMGSILIHYGIVNHQEKKLDNEK